MFHNNRASLIVIIVEQRKSYACKIVDQLGLAKNVALVAANISFMRCQFIDNSKELLTIENKLNKANVLIESLSVLRTSNNLPKSSKMISSTNMNVHIKGPIKVSRNNDKMSIIEFRLCDITFSGIIIFDSNYCNEIISLDNYIKVMEHANIIFINNKYFNKLIDIKSYEEYNHTYPFCLLQYITTNNASNNYTLIKRLQTHYI